MTDPLLPTRQHLPIILIRGFGGLSPDEERQATYQGFNEGSVYPLRRGENYIYEGFILKLIKADYSYADATNVIAYFAQEAPEPTEQSLQGFSEDWKTFFRGDRIVADPDLTREMRRHPDRAAKTFWVFRYYDLEERSFPYYGKALERLVNLVREVCRPEGGEAPKVNIVAHSMGGLIVREAIQREDSKRDANWAVKSINKVVTLGTPHKGISFQVIRSLKWLPWLDAGDELQQFNPAFQDDSNNPSGYARLSDRFPLDRLLCVVGTDYRNYQIRAASLGNRLFSVAGEFGLNYNRSDGLVKQANAQVDGAPRTFVHKPHGGGNSLMTARESFEIATRFFFGDIRVRVRLVKAKVMRKLDIFGRSEIFFGLKVKPRRLDFELFHQSREAENCYGPFREIDLSDKDGSVEFGWAGPDRLIWEGYLTSLLRRDPDIVLRADIYVGERDLLGFGFSDTLIFGKQYYVRAMLEGDPAAGAADAKADRKARLRLEWHVNQDFQADGAPATFDAQRMTEIAGVGWHFPIGDGDSFEGTLQVELDWMPETGRPMPLLPGSKLSIRHVPNSQADQIIDAI